MLTGFAILIIACFAIPLALCVLQIMIICVEKLPVRMFEKDDAVEIPPYMAAVIVRAEAHGFRRIGTGRHTKYKRIVAVLMHSADENTIATIGQGTIYRIPYKKTLLYSQYPDGSTLKTLDHAGLPEPDPKTERQLLVNAGFDELFALHERDERFRMPFPPDTGWQTIDALYRRMAARIVQAGRARYTDDTREHIRYTLGFAVHAIMLQFSAPAIDPHNYERRKLKRPDSRCPHCGYDLRATPDRCPECGKTWR